MTTAYDPAIERKWERRDEELRRCREKTACYLVAMFDGALAAEGLGPDIDEMLGPLHKAAMVYLAALDTERENEIAVKFGILPPLDETE